MNNWIMRMPNLQPGLRKCDVITNILENDILFSM